MIMTNNMVMIMVNVFEIKAKLSEYLDRAAGGERIVICRHNTPVAELRAVERSRTVPRPVGPLEGRPAFDVPQSFFEPMPIDELALWEDGALFPTRPAGSDRPRPPSGRRSQRSEPVSRRRARRRP
jgi:prevent-host-death family protein